MHLGETASYLKHKGFQNITVHTEVLKYLGKVQGHYPILKPIVPFSILMNMVLYDRQLEEDTQIVETEG